MPKRNDCLFGDIQDRKSKQKGGKWGRGWVTHPKKGDESESENERERERKREREIN